MEKREGDLLFGGTRNASLYRRQTVLVVLGDPTHRTSLLRVIVLKHAIDLPWLATFRAHLNIIIPDTVK